MGLKTANCALKQILPLLQVHHSGPPGAPLLPGEQWCARGAGRGGRHGEVGPEAVAAHGRHQEAPREVQGQQRHRVSL